MHEKTLQFDIGEQVPWIYIPHGDYGYSYPVNDVVISTSDNGLKLKSRENQGKM